MNIEDPHVLKMILLVSLLFLLGAMSSAHKLCVDLASSIFACALVCSIVKDNSFYKEVQNDDETEGDQDV